MKVFIGGSEDHAGVKVYKLSLRYLHCMLLQIYNSTVSVIAIWVS